MCVNAKHNKLNDDNPNATVTVQLNFIKQKENNVKSLIPKGVSFSGPQY